MMRKRQSLLEEIFRIITDSSDPDQTLDAIVRLVAECLSLDVCSVYLFDETRQHLVLRATVGLRPESVGSIRMNIQQGLTGRVLETMVPVFVNNPAEHPRYKYFEDSGEEVYHTFLGIPLVYHQQNLGVLVLQTLDEQAIGAQDIPVFEAIASQISATVAYSGLLENFRKEQSERRTLTRKLSRVGKSLKRKKSRKSLLRGTPVSAGFAEGRAHYLMKGIGFDQVRIEETDDPALEKERLVRALGDVLDDVRSLIQGAEDLPTQDAAILEAHAMMAQDPSFKRKLFQRVEAGLMAESALKMTVQEYLDIFQAMENPYLRQRAADIEDIGTRLLVCLVGSGGRAENQLEQPTILIASDISAVDLVGLRQPNLAGIVLARGGRTSHAAILAKSFEIPMVIGVSDVLDVVGENDFLIMDSTSGMVFREPPPAIIEEYGRLKAEKEKRFLLLDGLRDLPAETMDGHRVDLGANIGLLSDLDLAAKYGADHIGLYRTEFPFLVRKDFPTEDEQLELYKKVLEQADGKSVTFRTLDVGGDKFLSYLDYPREQNPYLGWRSVRVSLELDDVFRTQIRAILKASVHGPAQLLFPMISSLSEVRQVLGILEEEKQALRTAGETFEERLPVGIMVEVPAAVKILNSILRYVDFISIGTNDLIQYTLAVDRNNEKVAGLYNPLHPAVVATIWETVSACKARGKPVSICGEAASIPRCACLFLAMEVERLSMNAAGVPAIKELIRSVSLQNIRPVLDRVLTAEEPGEIASLLETACYS